MKILLEQNYPNSPPIIVIGYTFKPPKVGLFGLQFFMKKLNLLNQLLHSLWTEERKVLMSLHCIGSYFIVNVSCVWHFFENKLHWLLCANYLMEQHLSLHLSSPFIWSSIQSQSHSHSSLKLRAKEVSFNFIYSAKLLSKHSHSFQTSIQYNSW